MKYDGVKHDKYQGKKVPPSSPSPYSACILWNVYSTPWMPRNGAAKTHSALRFIIKITLLSLSFHAPIVNDNRFIYYVCADTLIWFAIEAVSWLINRVENGQKRWNLLLKKRIIFDIFVLVAFQVRLFYWEVREELASIWKSVPSKIRETLWATKGISYFYCLNRITIEVFFFGIWKLIWTKFPLISRWISWHRIYFCPNSRRKKRENNLWCCANCSY